MFEKNRIYPRKETGSPSFYAPFCAMCERYRFSIRSVAILISFIAFTSLFLPVLSQSKDSIILSYMPGSYNPDAFYQNARAFMVYHERMPLVNKYHFSYAIDENFLTHNENKTAREISFRFDDDTMPRRMFEVNPSLLLPGENVYSQWYPALNIAFNIESPFYQFQLPLPQEQKTYNLLHENSSDRLAANLESAEEPILRQPSYIPFIDPIDDGNGKYALYKDSKSQNGGNIKLPLSVPWSLVKTNRTGILPDTIYIGTDFDYFRIAESLQSWKSGNNTLSSDLNRIGSECLDTRSGYIYFEWRFGK